MPMLISAVGYGYLAVVLDCREQTSNQHVIKGFQAQNQYLKSLVTDCNQTTTLITSDLNNHLSEEKNKNHNLA